MALVQKSLSDSIIWYSLSSESILPCILSRIEWSIYNLSYVICELVKVSWQRFNGKHITHSNLPVNSLAWFIPCSDKGESWSEYLPIFANDCAGLVK